MIRALMTHRALIQRDANSALKDPYGNALTPSWATLVAAQACYYYEPKAQRGEQLGERDVNVYAHQLLIPLAVAVTESDRISGITDRRGETVQAGLFEVKAIVRRRDHQLLTLQAVHGE